MRHMLFAAIAVVVSPFIPTTSRAAELPTSGPAQSKAPTEPEWAQVRHSYPADGKFAPMVRASVPEPAILGGRSMLPNVERTSNRGRDASGHRGPAACTTEFHS
jgi:hypothetical protein